MGASQGQGAPPMAKSPAHRATRTLLVACVCLSSLVLVLGGGEQEPNTSMVLTETHEQEHVSGQGRMSRILKQLSGSKSLKTADSDAPSLPTVSGLAARFGQKQKKKKSAPQQPEMFGKKLSEDGDSELEKLSESGNDEDNNEHASQKSWGQKAGQVSLVPNQREEKVKDWLLHPNRGEGKYRSWMGIKAPKKTNKATVSVKAKAVAKRVQQTALAQTAKQPAAPLPSVLKIHAGNLIVNHVPAKLPAEDAIVPQKQSPLQQLRSAHKAVQLATTKPASSASQAKAQPQASGNAELNKIEEMSNTSDDDDEEDDMDKEEAKYQSDDDKDWFDKIEEDPDAAIRDSQDGENIKDFLHREARALKREGKQVGTTKSVLDQQMAEQHETPVVKHITPFVEVQSSPEAPATPAAQPQAAAKVSKPEEHKVAKVGDTVVPGLHDPLAAMMAKKRTQEVAKQASQSKSAVDDIIHQLGGPEEDVEFF